MQTSYNNNIPQFAGFFVRLAAFLIDTICIGSVLLLLRWSITSSFRMMEIDVSQTKVLFEYSILDVSLYLIQVLYFIMCTYLTGTTLGKKLLNLRVINVTGGRLSLFSVVYRETIGRFLSGLFGSIGYIIVGIDKEKRGIHDFFGDTRVIYATQPVIIIPPAQPVTPVQASQVQPAPSAQQVTPAQASQVQPTPSAQQVTPAQAPQVQPTPPAQQVTPVQQAQPVPPAPSEAPIPPVTEDTESGYTDET